MFTKTFLLLMAALLASACAPGTTTTTDGDQRPAPAPGAGRTLVMLSGAEPPSFALKPLVDSAIGIRSSNSKHVLNATLTELDPRGLPVPFLTEALPQLNTGSWQVFPDGTMETTYRLRPSLSWHDGQPLTAGDFVFAWRVYTTPQLGVAATGALAYMRDVLAPDPRSVLIRWKQQYTEAAAVEKDFPPLPRHLLEGPYQELSAEAFTNHAFWTEDYVSAGPWRLERREPGAFFEGSAFDGFVFGRPKIERVRVIYIADNNIMVTTLLAGEGHYAIEGILFGEEGLALEHGWGAGGGNVLWEPNQGRVIAIQFRPEFAVPTQLATDVRVRRALAHAIDMEGMLEAVTAGHGVKRELFSHPNADYYEAVSRAVPTRYRFDQRRAQQLLEEAGFIRGADGFWVTPTGERFTLEQWYLAGGSNERESTILVDGLRRFGIDATSHLWGVQRTSPEERAKTSGIFGGQQNMPDGYHRKDIARPETRWTGSNRQGFNNAELDRGLDAWATTLDRSARWQPIAEAERVAMDQLPALLVYWVPRAVGYSSLLKPIPHNLTPEGYNNARQIWTWEWQA